MEKLRIVVLYDGDGGVLAEAVRAAERLAELGVEVDVYPVKAEGVGGGIVYANGLVFRSGDSFTAEKLVERILEAAGGDVWEDLMVAAAVFG